jgi:hypothetical protein
VQRWGLLTFGEKQGDNFGNEDAIFELVIEFSRQDDLRFFVDFA